MDKYNRFRVAVKGFIVCQGKFLIVKRSKISRGEHGFWEFPGGRLEFGEVPQIALQREAMEEIQMEIDVHCPLGVWNVIRGTHTQVVGITFLCVCKNHDITLSHEHVDYRWITRDEIEDYKVFPEIIEEMKEWDWELIERVSQKELQFQGCEACEE